MSSSGCSFERVASRPGHPSISFERVASRPQTPIARVDHGVPLSQPEPPVRTLIWLDLAVTNPRGTDQDSILDALIRLERTVDCMRKEQVAQKAELTQLKAHLNLTTTTSLFVAKRTVEQTTWRMVLGHIQKVVLATVTLPIAIYGQHEH